MKNGKRIIIVMAIIIILLIAIVAVGLIFFYNSSKQKTTDPAENNSIGTIGYETNVVTNEEDLQKVVDGMVEQAKEGNIALEYKGDAVSNDGKTFSCYIANSAENKYDMFLAIYEDSSYEKEYYVSKLLSAGTGIESFEVNEPLEKGEHQAVLVFTQVEDDHSTIHAQVAVTINLRVN